MRIAVTGATGFLGRYIVARLAEAGHRLRCWHRPHSDRGGFGAAADCIEWQQGQLGDAGDAHKLVQGVDALVHAALLRPNGAGFIGSAKTDLPAFLQANLMGSLQLFQAAVDAGVKRCVFISTCAVHDVILNDRPLDETHPLWPKSHYGAHKAALEAFVHSYGLGEGWPICALRPTGIYGLAHPPEESKWSDLVGKVMNGEPISTAQGGKEVHAADAARAVDLLLNAEAKTVAGQAYNCTGGYIADQEVAQIAKELSGSVSSIADLNRGPKNQIDTSKLRALGMTFGGAPLLRQTVQQLVEAYRHAAP
jgi:nucleoside-diphosphate-sugar epimerase